jgi:hypothetical protein
MDSLGGGGRMEENKVDSSFKNYHFMGLGLLDSINSMHSRNRFFLPLTRPKIPVLGVKPIVFVNFCKENNLSHDKQNERQFAAL